MSIIVINQTGTLYSDLGLTEKGRLYQQFAFSRLSK